MNRPIDPDLDGYPDMRKMSPSDLRKALIKAITYAAQEQTENRRLKKAIRESAVCQREGMAKFIKSKTMGAHMRYNECRHAAECLEALLERKMHKP